MSIKCQVQSLKQTLYKSCDNENQQNSATALFYSFIFTFIFGFITHGYAFSHLFLTHDSLYEFDLTQNYAWKVQLGRFFNPVLRYILGEKVILPWANGIFGLSMIALAVFFTVKAFGNESKLKILAVSAMFCTNKTITALVATYMEDYTSDTMALMLGCLCFYIWSKNWKQKFNLKTFIMMASLTAVILGLYQAYISVTMTLMAAMCLIRLLNGERAKDVFAHGFLGLLSLLFGGIVYLGLCKVACVIIGVTLDTGKYNSLSNMWELPGNTGFVNVIRGYLYRIFMCYVAVIKFLFYTERVTFVLLVTNAALLILCVYGIIKRFGNIAKSSVFFALLILAFSPIIMTPATVFGDVSHDLTVFSVWFIYLFPFLIFADKQYDFNKTKVVFSVILCVTVFAFIQQSNMVYVEKEMTVNATQHLMNRVISDIEDNEDYDFNKTPVVFIGMPGERDLTPTVGYFRYLGGLNSAITVYDNYYNYFKCVFKYPIVLGTEDDMERLKKYEEVKEMPTYPTNGYVKMVDGFVVVKW